MQPNNNDFTTQANLIIVEEKLKKMQIESEEEKNMFEVAKPKLTALLNVARDESSGSLARFFGKTDRIKEDDVSHAYSNGIVTITVKNLKDVKSHTKPFIEKLFGKQILIKSSTEDRITVPAYNTNQSVTIKLTMDELMFFNNTGINQVLIDNNNQIVKIERDINTNNETINTELHIVEEILRSNSIVNAQDKFLTDTLNTHTANETLKTCPYAKAVKNKGASAGVVEICKILDKQNKLDKKNKAVNCKYQSAKTSIEDDKNKIFNNIKQGEDKIAALQKEISDLRKQNAKTHKKIQSDFCKEYHQKHLDNLFGTLKLSTEALKAHNQIPDTSNATVKSIAENTQVKEVLEKTLLEYQKSAVKQYENKQSLENRIDNLKDMNQNTEDKKINIKTKEGMEQVMSTYLTESEINNYNYFVDIHKAATSDADKALMRTAYTLLNNAELKTNLETEIASTTKQIARLITEHNDIRFYTEEDKTMLKTELNKLQGTSKSLAAQALKMIDKITVQQNTITATSGNPHSMPSQGGNNNPEVKLDIRSMSNNNQQSKLHSKLVATDVTKAYAYTDNPLQRKDSSLSSQGGKQK